MHTHTILCSAYLMYTHKQTTLHFFSVIDVAKKEF